MENFFNLDDVLETQEENDVQRDRAFRVFWENASFRLNNSLSLLQQGVEIALKARIARVSPFLLIAGNPQSWSNVESNGHVEFTDLRTIDAIYLVKAANAVSKQRLDPKFSEIYERLRKSRNKIQHLDGRVIRSEGSALLVDIMTCQRHLYLEEPWVKFRRTHLEKEDSDSLIMMQTEDYSRSTLMSEMSNAFRILSKNQILEFFAFDVASDAWPCPSCLGTRADWDDNDCCFVQPIWTSGFRCSACEKEYTQEEYETEMADWA